MKDVIDCYDDMKEFHKERYRIEFNQIKPKLSEALITIQFKNRKYFQVSLFETKYRKQFFIKKTSFLQRSYLNQQGKPSQIWYSEWQKSYFGQASKNVLV